jgi:hypothetical protein
MMNILDVTQTTTAMVTFTFSPTQRHYIFFGNDYVEVQQELRFEYSSINIDSASMQSIKESQFLVRFVRDYEELDKDSLILAERVDTMFENQSKNKVMSDANIRNFEMKLFLQEQQFNKIYDLYLAKVTPAIFTCVVNLDLYRDSFKYLGKTVDGVESYLLNDIRDKDHFGCKFKIASFLFEA